MSKKSFNQSLDKSGANYSQLTPINFLKRSAMIYPHKDAIVYRDRRINYAEFYDRSRRLARALIDSGVEPGDTVSIMAPNIPALLEAHFGVPMCGAVLNAVNTRLDADAVRFIIEHAEAKVFIYDEQFSDLVQAVIPNLQTPPATVCIADSGSTESTANESIDYEQFVANDGLENELEIPQDEWDAIALNYTSGTTGDPKGVVYHHRGAYLAALSNCLQFKLSNETVYLWTLPMFHCNGWSCPWAVTAAGGTHVCLDAIDTELIFKLIASERVTHFSAAPIVLNMLLNTPEDKREKIDHRVDVATGGAAPPSQVIFEMENLGFTITQLYGTTESYGPAAYCAWQDEWANLGLEERSRNMARQGVAMPSLNAVEVRDAEVNVAVPADGKTMGEIAIQGNTVMKGYFKNDKATDEVFKDGWLYTGDLAVMHEDGYIEIKDRSKDIIISGGENISSLEVEEVLFQHPAVFEVAVVAQPDNKWGEVPCAFITLSEDSADVTKEQLISYCRVKLAGFKVPKNVVFGELPRNATGKVQKNLLREQAKLFANA